MSESTIEAMPRRHGLLTFWLVAMLFCNVAIGAIYLFNPTPFMPRIGVSPANYPVWLPPILTVLNIASAIALLQWLKWGFWGVCASALLAAGFNLSLGFPPITILVGLISPLALYALLNIGDDETRAWRRLR